MNFISQTIVFALALMGILFKSTKTDADGKTMHTASGLPVLTPTGWVVLTLLSISFCISLVAIWQKNKSEDDARREKEELKQYNRGVGDTLTQLSEEQKKKFQDVLTLQENSGNKIVAGISTSADLLRSRIEDSSAVLSSRIGSSINLLNHSTKALASLSDPITTIEVGLLMIEVPLKDPALAEYRDRRVEPAIRAFLASPGTTNLYHLRVDNDLNRKVVTICSNSPLLPDQLTEPVAYNLLSFVNAYIVLSKKQLTNAQVLDPNSIFDLSVHVARRHNYTNKETDCEIDPNFTLSYDVTNHRAFVSVKMLGFARPPLNPPNPGPALSQTDLHGDNNWTKRAGGEINGVPDLAGAHMILHLGRFIDNRDLDLPGVRRIDDHRLSLAIIRTRRQSKMSVLKIVLSGEVTVFLLSEEETRRVGSIYLFHVMRLVADKADSYYVYTFPNSVSGLIPWGRGD